METETLQFVGKGKSTVQFIDVAGANSWAVNFPPAGEPEKHRVEMSLPENFENTTLSFSIAAAPLSLVLGSVEIGIRDDSGETCRLLTPQGANPLRQTPTEVKRTVGKNPSLFFQRASGSAWNLYGFKLETGQKEKVTGKGKGKE